jgi:hypothetical protein
MYKGFVWHGWKYKDPYYKFLDFTKVLSRKKHERQASKEQKFLIVFCLEA